MDVNDVVIENTLPPKTLVNITALGYVVSGVPIRMIELDGVEIKTSNASGQRPGNNIGMRPGGQRDGQGNSESGAGRPNGMRPATTTE